MEKNLKSKIEKEIALYDRTRTNSAKWDGLSARFGETDLLPLWVADMDFKSPQCVRDALQKAVATGAFGYATVPEDYWENFLRWEQERHGYAAQKAWLRTSSSVVTSIYELILALTAPGDRILTFTPIYYPFFHAIADTGRSAVFCELKAENGVYTIDFFDLEQKIRENGVHMLLLSSPHNPGSRVWTRAELEKIVAISKANQVEILSDEIHHDLVFPGYTHIPTATVGGFSDHVITLTSASKTFNLAGMKNSFLIMENEDTQKKYDALCKKTGIDEFNTFGYLAAAAAYQGGADWLSAVLAIIQNNYELLQKALAPFPEITLSPLQGTYLAWLDFEKAVPHAELRDLVQKEAHLAVDYGDWFFPKGKADCHIRLNLAAPAATIQKAAAALAAAIEKRKKENH